VTLESRDLGGARVIIELPRFAAHVYRLLVVDDDPAVRRALAHDLRREGFDVLIAGTLAEALQTLRSARVHVVLADWQLPDAGGIDLVQALTRETHQGRLVVTSADPSVLPSDGVEHVLAKPWDREQLLQIVRSLCLKGERRSQRPPGQ
jgi:CheY-like chemotaxis protein